MFQGKTSRRFLWAVILSFSFSMTVILATLGIMDGFENTLKSTLHRSSGDLVILSRNGFFNWEQGLRDQLHDLFPQAKVSPLIQTQGFLVKDGKSKGVLLRGIDNDSFTHVTDLPLGNLSEGLCLGKELADFFKAQVKDQVTLVMSSGNSQLKGLPSFHPLLVDCQLSHGIYEKDERLVYIERKKLEQMLAYAPERINMLLLRFPSAISSELLESRGRTLEQHLGWAFSVRPYWSEFESLIQAVKVEKLTIAIILQLIVIVSVFNIAGFIIFLNSQHARELFLLEALGATKKQLVRFWLSLVSLLWFMAIFFSLAGLQILDWALKNWDLFKLPGNIYVLSRLKLMLDGGDYLLVYLLSLAWVFVIVGVIFYRLKKVSILQNLRREFS